VVPKNLERRVGRNVGRQAEVGLGARGSRWNENMASIAACMFTATPQITNAVE